MPRASRAEPPQYRELRSLEAESLRSLAPLRDSGLARRGAARSSAADPGRFASPAALLELRRNTWRGEADVEDAGIHGMTFKYAGRRENPLKCEGIVLGTCVFTCRGPLETLTQTQGDVKIRWNLV